MINLILDNTFLNFVEDIITTFAICISVFILQKLLELRSN